MRTLLLLCLLLGLVASLDFTPRLIEFNETYRSWLTPNQVDELAEECGAQGGHGGFFDVTDHLDLSPSGLKVSIPRAFPANLAYQTYVNALLPKLSRANLESNNKVLSNFRTRYYTTTTGQDAAFFIRTTFEKYSNNAPAVSVSLFPHSWLQPSVVARIEGRTNPDEIVIIGAHEDSINNGANGIAPGADDDASGTVTVLEIFRVLVEAGWVPQRTIEFHTYAAEEVGLRGSQDIASSYQKQGKKVYAMLQLDMTFYSGASKTPTIGIVTDYVDKDLTAFLRKVCDAYSLLKWTDTTCGYACSDHGSWSKAGYAAAFPFEATFANRNTKIHTVNDVISILDLTHGLEFAKIGLGFLVELGGRA